eukprot:c33411_g1_i1 orf=529-705(-)
MHPNAEPHTSARLMCSKTIGLYRHIDQQQHVLLNRSVMKRIQRIANLVERYGEHKIST